MQAFAHSYLPPPVPKSNFVPIAIIVNWFTALTPTDKWDSNNESGGCLTEHNDQLLEHEHSLCSHPHHSHQCKVVDQSWHSHTASVHTCLVNTSYKDNQHAEQCYAELYVKFRGISLAKLPIECTVLHIITNYTDNHHCNTCTGQATIKILQCHVDIIVLTWTLLMWWWSQWDQTERGLSQ